ncbi:MAG: hypothetical protein Fur0022_07590 [Anaerolineales bacterium]
MKQGALVFADISGYTQFSRMHVTSLLHAEAIISELLEAVVRAAEFPLKVCQLEGDAVLLVAETPPGKETEAARDVAWQIQRLFVAFNRHARALITCDAGCVCDACRSIGQLKLKAVVHFGEFTLLKVGALEELAGEAIRFIRALIKTPIPEREYILLTPHFYQLSGGLPFYKPERTLELDGGAHAQVYFPSSHTPLEDLPPHAGRAFAARLNRHSFARMFGRKARATYNSLENGQTPLIPYLLEGILSGINVLRKVLWGNPAPIQVQPSVVVLVELYTSLSDLDRLRADLLNGLLGDPAPLTLNKLGNGTALFYTVVNEENGLVEREVLHRLKAFYQTFRVQTDTLANDPRSPIAKRGSTSLTFRAVAHFGPVAFKRILDFDEIAGETVILAHRLLKNSVSTPEYLLFTETLSERLSGDALSNAERQVETTGDMGDVPVRVVDLREISVSS